MARHAGFAAAISLEEAYLNQMLWLEFAKLDPVASHQLFTLPSHVPVAGGQTARLTGVALFEPRPAIKLQASASNTILVSASAVAYVLASLESGATVTAERTYKVRLHATMRVSVDVEVAADGLYLRWVPAGSSVQQFSVKKLEGPSLPGWLAGALSAHEIQLAMNTALKAIGPVRISGRLFPRVLEHIQTANFPSTGVSLFEWFRVHLTVESAPVRVLNGAIAVGVNLRGHPAGNPANLVNLNTHWGDSTTYSASRDMAPGRPLLVPATTGGGDVHALINAGTLSAIVADISRQISGTPVHPQAKIKRISLRPDMFDKPLRGRERGLRFDVVLDVIGVGEITAVLYLQLYFRGGSWNLYVGHSEIGLPWWIDWAVVLLGISLSAILPFLTPLFLVGVIAVTQGIIPSAVGGATWQAQAALGAGMGMAGGMEAVTIRGPRGDVTAYRGTKSMHVSSDGVGVAMLDVIPSIRFEEPGDVQPVARLNTRFNAGSPQPYRLELALRGDLASLASYCRVSVVVRRNDTGEVIAQTEGGYQSHRILHIQHLSQTLYHVDEFRIQARIYLNRLQLEGLLFATDTVVTVTDDYDRSHPYVTWLPHTAHFPNPYEPGKFWHRDTYPHIHRTAASARCLVLKQRAERQSRGPWGLQVKYLDDLGMDFSRVRYERKHLCDYCFFGGPDHTDPYPEEDWFVK